MCCLAKQQANKANLANLYPWRRVIFSGWGVCVWGGGEGGDGTWGTFGMCERARILNPIISLVLERNDLFINLIEQNVCLFR